MMILLFQSFGYRGSRSFSTSRFGRNFKCRYKKDVHDFAIYFCIDGFNLDKIIFIKFALVNLSIPK